MNETTNRQFIDEEQLAEISAGANAAHEKEVYCPNCGRMTKVYPVSGGLYTCTVCNRKHNGERVIGTPRA